MAYLDLLIIQEYLLIWLCSILLIYQHLNDSNKVRLFSRYIMMYPCHSLLRISDFEIIFYSCSTCKSKYETTHIICDPQI